MLLEPVTPVVQSLWQLYVHRDRVYAGDDFGEPLRKRPVRFEIDAEPHLADQRCDVPDEVRLQKRLASREAHGVVGLARKAANGLHDLLQRKGVAVRPE